MTRVIHGLMAKGKEKSARLQLLMTCPDLTPDAVDLVVTGRNCVGADVGDRVGVICPFRQAGQDQAANATLWTPVTSPVAILLKHIVAWRKSLGLRTGGQGGHQGQIGREAPIRGKAQEALHPGTS